MKQKEEIGFLKKGKRTKNNKNIITIESIIPKRMRGGRERE